MKNTIYKNITALQFGLLAAATTMGYYHTLDVPFYLDDFHTILERALIYKNGSLAEIWGYSPARFIAFYSFYLNYQIGALNLAAYHLVNIAIHLGGGFAAFLLTRLLLNTPAIAGAGGSVERLTWQSAWLPFAVAMIFLLHPLQTQAVTYIVQRMSSLVAFFYLACLACYLKGRLTGNGWPWFLGAVLLALAAFLTKQNSFTLPFAIVLVELLLFNAASAKPSTLLGMAAGAVGASIVALQFLWLATGHGGLISPSAIASLTTENDVLSRMDYFASQQEVLWRYIGLFFWPVDQRLDYAIALRTSLWLYPTVVLFLGHLLVLYVAFLIRKRFPLVSFGLFFYYLAHAVESSVLPIRDLMFEHRAYLPNYGLALVVGSVLVFGAQLLYQRSRWLPIFLAVAIISAMGTTTWLRNNLWRDNVAFLNDNARLSPLHYRPLSQLGLAYLTRKQFAQGIETLKQSIRVFNAAIGNTGDLELPPEVFGNLLLAKALNGETKDVLSLTQQVIEQNNPGNKDLARLRLARGVAFVQLRDFVNAERELRTSLDLNPDEVAAKPFLAQAARALGKHQEAVSLDAEYTQVVPFVTVKR